MGISIRIFFVNDDGSLKRIPLTRYERMLHRDPKEQLPQYAGKRVKSVEVAVQCLERKPEQIVRIIYPILAFDSEGRIDANEQEEQRRLGIRLIPPILPSHASKQIVNGRHRFAKKSYDDRFRWTPTPEMEDAIVNAIFHVS